MPATIDSECIYKQILIWHFDFFCDYIIYQVLFIRQINPNQDDTEAADFQQTNLFVTRQ